MKFVNIVCFHDDKPYQSSLSILNCRKWQNKTKRNCIILIITLSIIYFSCDVSVSSIDTIPDSGKLVFTTSDSISGPPGIYTMNLDGSGLQPVAVVGDTIQHEDSDDYFIINTPPAYPRWSPDGNRIVCQITQAFDLEGIMLMDADGSNKRILHGGAKTPQWSPEGDMILFRRHIFLGAIFAVTVMDTSGKYVRDIPDIAYDWSNPQIFEGDTIWSRGPTGDFQFGYLNDRVYSRASVNVKPEPVYILGSNPHNEIFSYDIQTGKIIERLTYNDIDEAGFRLSPDGKIAAFLRNKEPNRSTLHMIKLGTGEHSKFELDGRIHPRDFNWSNNGSKIVFAKDEDPDRYRERYHLYMVDVENPNNQVRITSFQATNPDLFVP